MRSSLPLEIMAIWIHVCPDWDFTELYATMHFADVKRVREFSSVDYSKWLESSIPRQYLHPEWYYLALKKWYNNKRAKAIMEFDNQTAPQTFHIKNQYKAEVFDWFEKKFNQLPECVDGQTALYQTNLSPFQLDLEKCPPAQNGRLHPVSLMALILADFVKDCPTVLDLCGHPGGKSLAIHSMGRNQKITVADYTESKVESIKKNMEQFYPESATTCLVMDGTAPSKEIGQFHAVLADVPCSGSGILRRRPELRWRMTKSDLLRNLSLQRNLLEGAASLVQSGGLLIYSTCSINPEENKGITDAFLAKHSDFSEWSGDLSGTLCGRLGFNSRQTILPDPHELDGFYYRVMARS
jgi:16S rRNA (cytosine967-C5)-methyltransferase